MSDNFAFFLILFCMILCGLVFAETTPKSGYYTISMGDVKVVEKYSQLYKALNEGIKLSEECKCKVTIHRPDISIRWSKSLTSKVMSWRRPTQRENGDYLKHVDYYIISYWVSGGKELFIVVMGKKEDRTINDLTPGSWVFRIKAVDTDGLESGWSQLVMVSI